MEKEHVVHTIAPVYDQYSKILILGSFPSVKSREAQFFYGHPQNRFWKVISGVLGCSLPVTVEEKRQMLLSHGIAVWDVIASCEITGSSDSSIERWCPMILERSFGMHPFAPFIPMGERHTSFIGSSVRKLWKGRRSSFPPPARPMPPTACPA